MSQYIFHGDDRDVFFLALLGVMIFAIASLRKGRRTR